MLVPPCSAAKGVPLPLDWAIKRVVICSYPVTVCRVLYICVSCLVLSLFVLEVNLTGLLEPKGTAARCRTARCHT